MNIETSTTPLLKNVGYKCKERANINEIWKSKKSNLWKLLLIWLKFKYVTFYFLKGFPVKGNTYFPDERRCLKLTFRRAFGHHQCVMILQIYLSLCNCLLAFECYFSSWYQALNCIEGLRKIGFYVFVCRTLRNCF